MSIQEQLNKARAEIASNKESEPVCYIELRPVSDLRAFSCIDYSYKTLNLNNESKNT